MLIEVDQKAYRRRFSSDPNPFISNGFIELNKLKTERIVRLVSDSDRKEIGLVAGLNHGVLKSPFSAPFGGFHFRHENIYISEIDSFISSLKIFIELGIQRD